MDIKQIGCLLWRMRSQRRSTPLSKRGDLHHLPWLCWTTN